jgi:hypothetical protein
MFSRADIGVDILDSRNGSTAEVTRLNLKVGFPDSSRSQNQLVGLDSAEAV